MIYLTYNNIEPFEYSKEILKLSDYLEDAFKYCTSPTEPIPLTYYTELTFINFNLWFKELLKYGDIQYYEYKDMISIFNPEFFDYNDISSLIEIFKFAFDNHIRLLSNTIAYVIGSRNIKLLIKDDSYYLIDNKHHLYDYLKDYENENFEQIKSLTYKISLPLLMQILKNTNKYFSDDINKLVKEKYTIIPYANFEIKPNYIYTKDNKYKICVIPYNVSQYEFKYPMSICDYSLLTKIVFCDNIETIDDNSFKNCTNLETVLLSNSITIIGKYAFKNCYKLSFIVLSKNLEHIGPYAFENCSSLKSITIPDKIRRINVYTFKNCTSLETVKITRYMTHIEPYAFEGCTNYYKIKSDLKF